jgi:hypothetical protein
MNHALCISVEERQVERLIDRITDYRIGKERSWLASDFISPGAAAHRDDSRGSTLCAKHPKVRKQA